MERSEVVIIVHGTFSQRGSWWRPGSDFTENLNQCLDAKGSRATCWGQDREPFSWSGTNSEKARTLASYELEDYLLDLEEDDEIVKYHIVAHSHGANIALRTLQYIRWLVAKEPELTKLGTFVTLGAPFIHKRYDSIESWINHNLIDRYVLKIKTILTLLLVLICIKYLFGASTTILGISLNWQKVLFASLTLEFFRVLYAVFRRPANASRGLKVTTITSKNDEAIKLLQEAVKERNEPRVFTTWKPKAVFDTSLWKIFNRKTGTWTKYDDFRAINVMIRAEPYMNREKRINDAETRSGARAVISIPFMVIVFVATRSIAAIWWCFEVTLGRIARRYAVRTIATLTLGDDLVGEKIVKIESYPPKVICEHKELPLSETIESDLTSTLSSDISQSLTDIYESARMTNSQQLDVFQRLSEIKCVHTQYYQTPEIIEMIAEEIAACQK